MDKKLKADIAESAATVELLKRGWRVLRPVGDRLPYDLAVDVGGRLIRIQVKSAWFDRKKQMYSVDVRRTRTNKRRMTRDRWYHNSDFDFAPLYIDECRIFYIMPVAVFTRYGSTVSLVETSKRQRKPSSLQYKGSLGSSFHMGYSIGNDRGSKPVKFGEASTGEHLFLGW